MKKTLIVLFSGIIFLSFMQCGKEENSENQNPGYDTAFPHPFFPAWPGSYWVYNTGDTLRAISYQPYIYNKAAYDAVPDYDTVVAIKMRVKNIFNLPDTFALLKYNEISKEKNASYRESPFRALFFTAAGPFYGSVPWQGQTTIAETVTIDTTITLNNQKFSRVIICIWYDQEAAWLLGKSQAIYRREFWAENVGLIRRDEKPVPSGPENFVTTLWLSYYQINFPPDK